MILNDRAAQKSLPALTLFGLVLIGCGGPGGPEGKPDSGVQSKVEGNAQSGGLDEATAREKLKLALDSWTFGDDPSKFRKDHTEVSFLNTGYDLAPPALQRYEIGQGRKRSDPTNGGVDGYEFPVVLSLEGQSGNEVKKREVYSVRTRDNKRWTVSINVP